MGVSLKDLKLGKMRDWGIDSQENTHGVKYMEVGKNG